ncbi:MAG TPA: hypothetical protein VHB48_18840 [Chitinophagaceae bacterium]|nr:hypothetical protein [Chitinophagaceae bacterium]
MQIYSGFFELARKGVIKLKVTPIKSTSESIPITNVRINKKYTAVYDALDGLTWIYGDEAANLEHFGKTYNVDFYFKRSFANVLPGYAHEKCRVFPLGLNYNVQPEKDIFSLVPSAAEKIKYILKRYRLFRGFSDARFFYAKDFEHYPLPGNKSRVLFITRLWDPAEAKSERSEHFRACINNARVASIEACKKKYGALFTGGLEKNNFSVTTFPSLVLPEELTRKEQYLQAIKNHTICIATTGLHHSIGWKFAEYVAASRAIVTEPLQFELPGNFGEAVNYLSFKGTENLIEQIDFLLTNRSFTRQMMQNNFQYYNNYVNPERLVLNTLLKIADETLRS